MGACASKPKELKEELAPQPLPTVEEKVTQNVADIDDNKCLFMESGESKVASETEEVAVKETITPIEPVEAKEEPRTVEKSVTPTPEEVAAPSEATEATTEEKHADLSANTELPVPTDKVNAELPVASSTEELIDESNTENVVAESPKVE